MVKDWPHRGLGSVNVVKKDWKGKGKEKEKMKKDKFISISILSACAKTTIDKSKVPTTSKIEFIIDG